MNIYDFDHTIYDGDSSHDFCIYALRRHPGLCRYLPLALVGLFRYAVLRADRVATKEGSWALLRGLSDEQLDTLIADFWDTHRYKMCPWYLAQKKPDDVIISASPAFYLKSFVEEELGVRLIATAMDTHTGKLPEKNCHREEKVRRFRAVYGDAVPEEAYSDSDSDLPMIRLARKAFRVVDGKPRPWEF